MADRTRLFSSSIGIVALGLAAGTLVVPVNTGTPDRDDLATCAPGPKTTVATALNVRTSPFGGAVIGRLQEGTTVEVVACSGKWGKLSEGRWVHSDFLVDPARAGTAGK